MGLSALVTLVIIGKLFALQVIQHKYYAAKAQEGHLGYTEIEARRGEILIQDYHSNEIFRLATNTTLETIYADPTLIKDPSYIADKLIPLLFDEEAEQKKETERIRLARRYLPESPTEDDLKALNLRGKDELFNVYKSDLLTKVSQKTRAEIILLENPDEATVKALAARALPGVEVTDKWIIVKPQLINDREYTARTLSPIVDIPFERLSELLVGRNRYVVLKRRMMPSESAKIKELLKEDKDSGLKLFEGIGFQEEPRRFYPEGEMAGSVLGFMNDKGGVYGIEQYFDTLLKGEKGLFRTQLDATGQQITVGDDVIIQPSVDGNNITLTLDRSVQREVEQMLTRSVTATRADGGLVIVMEPDTGKIRAMAQSPTFDPNNFGEALATEDLYLTQEEKDALVHTQEGESNIAYLYLDRDSDYKLKLFETALENGKVIYEKYKNNIGPGAYLNKSVQEIYEPGSIMKVVAMSIALDAAGVTPNTTYNDTGPIKVDEYEIRNALDKYYGVVDMRTVISKSLNTGMAFVARKMGRDLFGRYLKKFGFGERTDIEFEGEQTGTLQDPGHWAESELVTYAFGQGIAVTPIQMITSVAALANGGILMQPTIVEKIESPDGKTSIAAPYAVRRVVSEKTAHTISAMMVNTIENGGAARAVIADHYVAGKTGTAQTYKHGKPLEGLGTTIVSFIGFAPIDHPRFIILVKLDRPRTTIWADATAAPLFKDITEFLFKYYNIPPDKK